VSQDFTAIQQAFDTQLLTVSGITTSNLFTENKTLNFAMQPDSTTKLAVRSTLIPATTTVETLGNAGYVAVKGLYSVDVLGTVNQGFLQVSQLADLILAAFVRGQQFTLPNGDLITINTSSPAPNVSQGAWNMNKLYAKQVMVQWFGYILP
jgi:hypothetical protein